MVQIHLSPPILYGSFDKRSKSTSFLLVIHGFESHTSHHFNREVAQLGQSAPLGAERSAGSNPVFPTIILKTYSLQWNGVRTGKGGVLKTL